MVGGGGGDAVADRGGGVVVYTGIVSFFYKKIKIGKKIQEKYYHTRFTCTLLSTLPATCVFLLPLTLTLLQLIMIDFWQRIFVHRIFFDKF